MKSGLEDRNNHTGRCAVNGVDDIVSMKSGLEDRNNKLVYLSEKYNPLSQ
ncbi:Uncharacterised protein [Arachnia propionica]|nr:Uncharacterised protein [Arachnia propionica]